MAGYFVGVSRLTESNLPIVFQKECFLGRGRLVDRFANVQYGTSWTPLLAASYSGHSLSSLDIYLCHGMNHQLRGRYGKENHSVSNPIVYLL
jgi:hypothetical protein